MSEHKNQHTVPACYLNYFEADISEQLKINPNYKTGVYVNDKLLNSGWKLHSIRHDIFTKSYYYNIGDKNRDPSVENFLSRVENNYHKYVKGLLEGIIENVNLSFISYFTTLQHMRVESFIDRFQATYDQLAKWMDDYEYGSSYQKAFKDLTKIQLSTTDIGDILHPYAHILYNQTKMPLITSDTPVVQRQVNITDLLNLFPKEYLDEDACESNEFSLTYFPLSPYVAYVSCELIRKDTIRKMVVNDLSNVFYLNILSIKNAYEYVYSSIKEPIKEEAALSKHLSQPENDRLIVRIYTNSKRIISPVKLDQKDSSSVSIFIDKNDSRDLTINENVKLIEILENGNSIRGMRHCTITDLNYDTGFIKIESKIKFGKK